MDESNFDEFTQTNSSDAIKSNKWSTFFNSFSEEESSTSSNKQPKKQQPPLHTNAATDGAKSSNVSSSEENNSDSVQDLVTKRRLRSIVCEKKRRKDLRNCFLYLKDQIPKLKEGKKEKDLPRIKILRIAISYIKSLNEDNESFQRILAYQLEKQRQLKVILACVTKT